MGFDWSREAPVFEKVLEEITEFRKEIQAENKNKEKIEEEFGDILFSLVNWARHLGFNASTALMRSNAKFDRRFRAVEKLAGDQDMKSMGLEKLDALWDEVKKEEH